MKNKIKPFDIWIDVYTCHVVFFIGSTPKEIIDWGIKHKIPKEDFTDDWKKNIEPGDKPPMGYTCRYGEGNSDVLVWLKEVPKKIKEWGTIFHEIYHAVDIIARDADPRELLYTNNFTGEPRAYLYEYIAKECMRHYFE